MLDLDQRRERYLTQTGRLEVTSRQRRRLDHKENHQSVDASAVREDASLERRRAADRHKVRGLLPH